MAKAFRALDCKLKGSGDPTQATLNKRQTEQKPHLLSKRLCIGTFNARTLKSKWRRLELAAWCSHKGVQILGVQEHCLLFDGKSSEVRSEALGAGWRFFWTSANAKGQGGVGCILAPSSTSSVLSIETVSPRLLRLILKWQLDGRKAHVLVGYAPTAVAAEVDRELFFDQLGAEVARTSRRDFLCVSGDLNATLRPEDHGVRFLPPQTPNDNSDLLSDLLSAENLLSMGTVFCQDPKRLYTFFGPRRKNRRKAALDHLLVRKHQAGWIKNATTQGYAIPTVASDHRPLCLIVRMRLQARRCPQQPPRRDWNLLKDERTFAKLNLKLKNTLSDTAGSGNSYAAFVEALSTAAADVLPLRKPKLKHAVWKDSAVSLPRERLKTIKTADRIAGDSQLHRHAKTAAYNLAKTYSRAELDHLRSRAADALEAARLGHLKTVWNIIDDISGRKAEQQKTVYKDDPAKILSSCEAFYKSILGPRVDADLVVHYDPVIPEETHFDTGPITMEELRNAVRSMPTGKATGPDGVCSDALGLPVALSALLDIFNTSLATGTHPLQFLEATVIPVFKKGNQNEWKNYRPITLMSVAAKAFNKILLNRLRVLDSHLRPSQNGFRRQRCTLQHVFFLRRLIEEANTKGTNLALCFVDFSRAFDSVSRPHLWGILKAYRVPDILLKAIQAQYNGHSFKILTSAGLTSSVESTVGVAQGDTMSPFLFVLVMDFMMRQVDHRIAQEGKKLGVNICPSTGSRSRRSEALYVTDAIFADDLCLLASDLPSLQELLDIMVQEAATFGLHVNAQKTKFLWTDQDTPVTPLRISGSDIERVPDFRYTLDADLLIVRLIWRIASRWRGRHAGNWSMSGRVDYLVS